MHDSAGMKLSMLLVASRFIILARLTARRRCDVAAHCFCSRDAQLLGGPPTLV